MTAALSEADVEEAALAYLESLGWTTTHGWNRPSAVAEGKAVAQTFTIADAGQICRHAEPFTWHHRH